MTRRQLLDATAADVVVRCAALVATCDDDLAGSCGGLYDVTRRPPGQATVQQAAIWTRAFEQWADIASSADQDRSRWSDIALARTVAGFSPAERDCVISWAEHDLAVFDARLSELIEGSDRFCLFALYGTIDEGCAANVEHVVGLFTHRWESERLLIACPRVVADWLTSAFVWSRRAIDVDACDPDVASIAVRLWEPDLPGAFRDGADAVTAAELVHAAADTAHGRTITAVAPSPRTARHDPRLVGTVADRLGQWMSGSVEHRAAVARSVLDAVVEHVATDGDPASVLIANIDQLAGHLDACLDGLGHTEVSSKMWLVEFDPTPAG